MRTLKFLVIVALIVSVNSAASAQQQLVPTGSWTFFANEAPVEYNTGDMIIQQNGEEFVAKIVFGENYEIKANGVKYENNEIFFKVYIEGEPISIKGIVGEESMEGTASTPDGLIKFIAERKK